KEQHLLQARENRDTVRDCLDYFSNKLRDFDDENKTMKAILSMIRDSLVPERKPTVPAAISPSADFEDKGKKTQDPAHENQETEINRAEFRCRTASVLKILKEIDIDLLKEYDTSDLRDGGKFTVVPSSTYHADRYLRNRILLVGGMIAAV